MSRSLPTVLLLLTACATPATTVTPPPVDAAPTAAEATAFMAQANDELLALWRTSSQTAWVYETDITDAHEADVVAAEEAVMGWLTVNIPQAHHFLTASGLDDRTRRQLELLRIAGTLPAPKDAAERAELAGVVSKMNGMYGKGSYCTGEGDDEVCRDLGELSRVLAESDDWDAQLDAWEGWRTVSPPMQAHFERFVTLGNTGARDLGFGDMGELWRAGYDMSPAEAEAETERLWQQVAPLYEQLHCYTRAKLGERYGAERVPQDGLIPAHVTGNMWAQSWDNLLPLLEPFPGKTDLDVTAVLQAQEWDALRIARTGEGFFTSMGLDPMPQTFWERSMFVKPEGRDVVCHASAWDVDFADDQRVKMCIEPTFEDFVTMHHELGHNYYNHYYTSEPVLFQAGAHDGFHEAIGDAIALSITPSYLQQIGLIDEVVESDEAVLNKQMMDALSKIAFLPFGRMIDQWRWDVFSGKVAPDQWNAHWWALRAQYQGVGAPGERPADAFDPGAKYHIPANTPYLRYFFASILQFQMHASMCDASGHEGPLHTCSVYGSKEAGEQMAALLSKGASQPWPDTLEAATGTRQMDAAPMVEYFTPLMSWLKVQNAGRACGWN